MKTTKQNWTLAVSAARLVWRLQLAACPRRPKRTFSGAEEFLPRPEKPEACGVIVGEITAGERTWRPGHEVADYFMAGVPSREVVGSGDQDELGRGQAWSRM